MSQLQYLHKIKVLYVYEKCAVFEPLRRKLLVQLKFEMPPCPNDRKGGNDYLESFATIIGASDSYIILIFVSSSIKRSLGLSDGN